MISVVIPLYNESNLINQLLEDVFFHLNELNEKFEVVCVNDGSTDTTLNQLKLFREKEEKLKIVSLSRNFGLQAAITAGLNYSAGDFICIMDGDFQDPPELIPMLYKKLIQSNAEIVTAIRQKRNEKLTRKIYVNIFHKIFQSVSDEKQIAYSGNFCMISRKALNAILLFAEKNRYLPGIRNIVGFKHAYINYERPNRPEGSSRMNRTKLFKLAADAIFSFSKWPVKLCLYSGIAGVVIFLGAIVYTLVSKLAGFAPLGWSSMFLAVSFFGSVQLTFLGIIGEYVYRIYKEVQNRPLYFIDEVYE